MERREDEEEGKQPGLPDLPIKGPVKIAKCAQAQNESRGALVLSKEWYTRRFPSRQRRNYGRHQWL
jgi:hypothetical protein